MNVLKERITQKFQGMSQRERFMIIGLLGIILLAGYARLLFNVVMPGTQTALATRDELETRLDKSRRTVADYPQLVLKGRTLKEEYARLQLRVLADLAGGEAYREVGQNLTGDARLVNMTPGALVEGKGYLTLPVTMTVEGNYTDIKDFFFSLETLPNLSVLTSVDLTTSGQAAIGDYMNPLLRGDLSVAFYGQAGKPGFQVTGGKDQSFNVFLPSLSFLAQVPPPDEPLPAAGAAGQGSGSGSSGQDNSPPAGEEPVSGEEPAGGQGLPAAGNSLPGLETKPDLPTPTYELPKR